MRVNTANIDNMKCLADHPRIRDLAYDYAYDFY